MNFKPPLRALVAENNTDSRKLMVQTLEESGFEVQNCVDGVEALAEIHSSPPDLIISDIPMPGLDGFELCFQVKQDSALSGIPFIFCTASHTKIADRKLAATLGVDRFLLKPIEPGNFIAILRDMLNEQSLKTRATQPNIDSATFERLHSELVTHKLERKVAMQAEKHTSGREMVRDLLDYTAEAIFGVDLQGTCTFANLACVRMLGYQDADELIGHHLHRMIHHKWPDGTPYSEDDCPMHYTLDTGDSTHVDTEVLWRADGSSFPAEYWTNAIHRDGKIAGAVVTFLDISERKWVEASLQESEARFRSIFQSSVVGMVVVINDDGTIAEWNSGAEEAFGYSAQEAVGKPLTILMPERYREAHRKGLAHAVTQGGLVNSGVTHELSGLRKNGQEFPLELTLGSWKIDKKLYFSAIILDITRRKQTEQALRRAQKMDAIGQLTGGIAHDFNNILGIIQGNLDLLKNQIKDDEKASKRVETIRKSAQRAADLTKQLLGFSRRRAVEVSITDINQTIGELKSLMARSVTPEVEVEYYLADDLRPTEIDPGDFEDAMLNLVINARDAMPGGGKLILETSNCTLDAVYCAQNPGIKPGEYIQLMVSDSGEGIANEQQDQIFEPFYTTKKPGKGTGLGLAMVYGFVQRSGGHIRVYSEPGIGSTFHLYLPQAQGQIQPARTASEPQEILPRGREVILAVDDERELLELAKTSLEALGYQVVTANNGQQALEQLTNRPDIDLLFSDVVMPGGMNGYELAEQATTKHPELKILLTSGYTGKALSASDQTQYSNNLLSKPYSQSELAQRLRALLGEPALPDEAQNGSERTQSTTPIEWADNNNVGVKALDDDHRELLALLNRYRESAANDDRTECIIILEQFRTYTKTHFQREEAVMAACAYPGLTN
ncbi:MAG: PAS domain S-box protein, partial [Gammaproteobacteria bacterium]|nr:PAS domain S-box protein [Gammaproteobacteria bacterium]